jgi:hypothetical protein
MRALPDDHADVVRLRATLAEAESGPDNAGQQNGGLAARGLF